MVEELSSEFSLGNLQGAATLDSALLFLFYHFGIVLMSAAFVIWVKPVLNAVGKIKAYGLLLLFGFVFIVALYFSCSSEALLVVPAGMGGAIWFVCTVTSIYRMNERQTFARQISGHVNKRNLSREATKTDADA